MKRFRTKEGRPLCRVSRWITIQHAENITPRHSCYYYAMDGNGNRTETEQYNPEENGGNYLDFFIFKGQKFALERFMRCGSMWCPSVIMFYDETGKLNHIAGIDSENYYNPLLIEIDESGEKIRCYYEE